MKDTLINHIPTEQIDNIFFNIPNIFGIFGKLISNRTILLILFFTGIFIIGLYSESRGKK